MNNTLRTPILAALFLAAGSALFLAAGCSRYDRELYGDPQPQPAPAPPVQTVQPADSANVDSDSMDVGLFNDLDYYGQWYQMDPYGWVWRPTVVMDWQPFTNGHWIWSQYGWTWVDYDAWGWATSHYGYWTTDFTLGWVWVPDYQWSPAQCEWMEYGDYVGWSPVPPEGARFKEPWEGSRAWVWVPVRKFKEHDIGGYRATPKFKAGSDTEVLRGAPDLQEVERRGPMFPLVQVELDRRVVKNREFAIVKYPPDQQDIIRRHPVVQPTPGSGYNPSPPPLTSSPNNDPIVNPTPVGPPQPQPVVRPEPKAKSKDSGSKPADSGKTETKYKEKKAEEKKDSGKSKDSTPAKKGKG